MAKCIYVVLLGIFVYCVLAQEDTVKNTGSIGQSCNTNDDCLRSTANSTCEGSLEKLCRCKPGFEPSEGQCHFIVKSIGEFCETDAQCQAKVQNSICSPGTYQCQYRITSVGQSCNTTQQCLTGIQNTVCKKAKYSSFKGKHCLCEPGYEVTASYTACYIKTAKFGEVCEINEQCFRRTRNSKCYQTNLGKRCLCNYGFEFDGFHCTRECEYDNDCLEGKICIGDDAGMRKCVRRSSDQIDSKPLKVIIGTFVGVFGIIFVIVTCCIVKRQNRIPRNNSAEAIPSVSEHIGCHCHQLDKPPSYEDMLNLDLPPSYTTVIGDCSAADNEGFVRSSVCVPEEENHSYEVNEVLNVGSIEILNLPSSDQPPYLPTVPIYDEIQDRTDNNSEISNKSEDCKATG